MGDLIMPRWTDGPMGYINAQELLISLWRTAGPVSCNGTPNQKTPRELRKIVPKRVLHIKIKDRCLDKAQKNLTHANKIATEDYQDFIKNFKSNGRYVKNLRDLGRRFNIFCTEKALSISKEVFGSYTKLSTLSRIFFLNIIRASRKRF